MAEVEGIMNSRPLTVEALSDVTSYKPLSPSDLLTMKSKVVLPPAGKFQKENLYTKKYWRRRVQHLAIAFWRQWRKELLLALQERQKWHLQKRNFRVGVIVLLKVDAHRNNRPKIMAKIIPVSPDKDGVVQMSNYLLVHVIVRKQY